MKSRMLSMFWRVAVCAFLSGSAFAQGTAFTYQGRLQLSGSPVNGPYDLQFILLPSIGSSTQVGATLTNSAVGVTNGLFTTVLDFGDVLTISPLYLQIGIRTNGSTNVFTILTPPQLLTSTPYAIRALDATSFSGSIVDSQLSANIPRLNGTVVFTGPVSISNLTALGTVGGTLSGTFAGNANGNFTGIATGTLIGDGSAITNLNVTNLAGVVQSNPNWQIVQTSPQQAVVANNYLTTNTSNTTLILPASPAVGSTLRVAGSGGNGFTLAQPAGQSIMTKALGLSAGQLITASTNLTQTRAWTASTVSANGLKMLVAYSTGVIYYSNDGGNTWTAATATASGNINQPWSGLAISDDGTRVVGVVNGGQPWTSTNGGTNFTMQSTSTIFFTCVASSADGNKLVAAASGANAIYTSPNAGVSWVQHTVTAENWVSIASSADGTKLAAAPNGSAQIFTSTDSGATWTNRGPTGVTWSGIASSADGNKLVATANTGLIYTSGDAGITWVSHNVSGASQAWTCVTSSDDGNNLAAAYSLGYIYTSADSGHTWLQRTNGVSAASAWKTMSTSGNGSALLAAVNTGLIYTSTAATTIGTNGFLFGSQYSSIEIQYIGSGQWMPLSFLGTFTAQ